MTNSSFTSNYLFLYFSEMTYSSWRFYTKTFTSVKDLNFSFYMKDFLNQPLLSYFIILSCQQVSSVLRCINTFFITVYCLCCLLCISSNQQIRVDVSSLTLFSVSHTAGFISHRSLKHRKNKSCRIKHITWISFSSCAADQSVSQSLIL